MKEYRQWLRDQVGSLFIRYKLAHADPSRLDTGERRLGASYEHHIYHFHVPYSCPFECTSHSYAILRSKAFDSKYLFVQGYVQGLGTDGDVSACQDEKG